MGIDEKSKGLIPIFFIVMDLTPLDTETWIDCLIDILGNPHLYPLP